MPIGIDIRALSTGLISGVEEYTVNLLENIFRLDEQEQYLLFYNGWSKGPVRFLEKPWPNVKIKKTNWPNRFFNFSQRFLHQPALDKLLGGVDVYFEPVFEFSQISKGVPRVMVFHDLSFEHFPQYFSRKQRWWHRLVNPRRLAHQVDQIIADSYSTRRDLIDIYQIDPGKIKVIYPGVPGNYRASEQPERAAALRRRYHLPPRFVLYLGTLEPRKNVSGLIQAFRRLQGRHPSLAKWDLVIAGRPGWLYRDILAAANLGASRKRIHFAGFIDNADKPYLYGLADIFVYPSFYEGFGFPPLEAMRAGVPVITSAVSSLPEVAGKAAILIDPHNLNELGAAIGELLIKQDLRENLRQAGFRQVQKFKWSQTAREVMFTITALRKGRALARSPLAQ